MGKKLLNREHFFAGRLLPIPLVVCFAGLTYIAVQAYRERAVGSIMEALVGIVIVGLLSSSTECLRRVLDIVYLPLGLEP